MTLSVVVPIYNVERYVEDCLASLERQTLTDFEVILVDDGSPDGSAEIVQRWCEQDSRFRLLHQANAGPGGARNTGVREATGIYLAFADGDDIVPPKAYAQMVRTLDQTGSDVCTGGVRRLYDAGTTRPTKLLDGVHAEPARSTSVRERPVLLRDVLSMNKMWRRSFWEDQKIRYPEGVVYEDIPTILPALVRANGIDVLTRVVYLWRYRGAGPASATQDRGDVSHVRNRSVAVTAVSEFLAEHAPGALEEFYDRASLKADFKIFLRRIDLVDDEYATETLRLVQQFLATVDPRVIASLDTETRVMYHLAERGDLATLQGYATFVRDGGVERSPHVVRNGRVLLELPHRLDADLPDAVVDDTDDLPLVTRVTRITADDHRWSIEGWAYIKGVPVASQDAATIRVALRPLAGDADEDAGVEMRVERLEEPEATVSAGHPVDNYDWSAFRATVSVRRLRRLAKHSSGALSVEVDVAAGPVRRAGRLDSPGDGRVRSPADIVLSRGRRWRPTWGAQGLVLHPVEPQIQITAAAGGQVLLLDLSAPSPQPDGALVAATARRRETFPVEWNGRTARVEIALPKHAATLFKDVTTGLLRGADATVEYAADNEDAQPIRLDSEPQGALWQSAGREIVLRRTETGHAGLTYRLARPRVQALRWVAPATLAIDVELPAGVTAATWQVRSRRTGQTRPGTVVAASGRGRTVHFAAGAAADDELALPLTSGWWTVEAVAGNETRGVVLPPAVAARLPEPRVRDGRTYTVESEAGALLLRVGSDLSDDERGAYRQHLLQTHDYAAAMRKQLEPTLLYDVFGGSRWTDSPRVLHDELLRRGEPLRHLVVSDEQQARVARSAQALPRDSRRHYIAAATSKVVVANDFLPPWFRPRRDQVVVQTWHGTTAKRVGRDSLARLQKDQAEAERQTRLAGAWSWMVSPSPYMSDVYRSAWDFQGRILEIGNPRNDIFRAADADALRERTRTLVGVADEQRLIMYAPTWRDNLAGGTRNRRRGASLLDLAALGATLAPADVLVVRAHPLAPLLVPDDESLPIRDASAYPDVAHLLLAADVLITDYSAVMFDFANTGRPMIFFTPDLDDYHRNVRGLYWDLEELAPGPVVREQAGVIEALSSDGTDQHGQRYAAFRDRFCPHDDGGVAARLADAVLGEIASL